MRRCTELSRYNREVAFGRAPLTIWDESSGKRVPSALSEMANIESYLLLFMVTWSREGANNAPEARTPLQRFRQAWRS